MGSNPVDPVIKGDFLPKNHFMSILFILFFILFLSTLTGFLYLYKNMSHLQEELFSAKAKLSQLERTNFDLQQHLLESNSNVVKIIETKVDDSVEILSSQLINSVLFSSVLFITVFICFYALNSNNLYLSNQNITSAIKDCTKIELEALDKSVTYLSKEGLVGLNDLAIFNHQELNSVKSEIIKILILKNDVSSGNLPIEIVTKIKDIF